MAKPQEFFRHWGRFNVSHRHRRIVEVYLKVENPRDGQEVWTGAFADCTPVPYNGDYDLYEVVGPVTKIVYRAPTDAASETAPAQAQA